MPIIRTFLCSLTLLSAEPRPMNGVDLLSIPVTLKASLSPDGSKLVFQKSEVHWESNRRISQLWMKNLSTGELRQLTHNQDGSREPHWAPDGNHLLFLSKRESDEETQIYLMPTDGGEARRLGELEKPPSRLHWSPDGKWIYFLTATEFPETEKKLLKKNKIIPRFEDPRKRRVLMRLEIETETLEQVSGPEDSIFDYRLSQDGEDLVLLKGEGVLLDNIHKADLWIASHKNEGGIRLTKNGIAEYSARFSPDKSQLAYLASVNEQDEGYHKINLFVVDRPSGTRTLLTKDFVGEVKSYAWDQKGTGLFLLGNIGVSNHLFHLQLTSGEITQLTSGPWTITEWQYDSASETHLYKRVSAGNPGDYWSFSTGQNSKRLTNLNPRLAELFHLPRQELVRWQGPDGVEIEGLLTYPLDFKEGTPFPLVTDTHGGPQKSDQYGQWQTGRYLPVLAAHGYGVLRVNHRGSTGYGDEFMRDMVGNYFRNSHLDILSGIDHLIAEGLVDPDRLVKKGWSAGGHMTNKLITYTDRFKAASSGAGAVDWDSQFGETDTFYRRTWWFGGKPWEENAPTANYQQSSPLNELWKVKTPTLIFVGEKDVRVPASQSKMLFRGLRDLGVETELYIAPGEPHGFRKPTHRLFRINKELEWFEHHVKGATYDYSLPETLEEED